MKGRNQKKREILMIQELGTKSLPEQVKRDGIDSAKGAGLDVGRLVHLEVGGSNGAYDNSGH